MINTQDALREVTLTPSVSQGLVQFNPEQPKPKAWFSLDGSHVRFECYGDIPTAEAIVFCEDLIKTVKELAND